MYRMIVRLIGGFHEVWPFYVLIADGGFGWGWRRTERYWRPVRR